VSVPWFLNRIVGLALVFVLVPATFQIYPGFSSSCLSFSSCSRWYARMYSRCLRAKLLTSRVVREVSRDRHFLTFAKKTALPFFWLMGRPRYRPFEQPQLYSIPSPAISVWYFGVRSMMIPSFRPTYCSRVSSFRKSGARLVSLQTQRR
jgi:hypothetical protein